MRIIHVSEITKAIEKMAIESNIYLPSDVQKKLDEFEKKETCKIAKDIFKMIKENINIAKDESIPLCQDTGMAVIFMEIGQEVYFEGESLKSAIDEGVKRGYEKGYLRKSIIKDPLDRSSNTKTNTPSVCYTEIVDGDKVNIKFAPKGFGSENMSAIKMMKPSDSKEKIIEFVLETIKKAGANPCPPIVVGIGIGGTMDKAAQIAKKALLRPLDSKNSNKFYENMENEILEKINELKIGVQGLGGDTTALKVQIETYPTHIAGLPVAVNINCHVCRHQEVTI